MRAQPLVEVEVAPFANEIEIEVAEERGQRVGIDHALNAPIFPLDIEPIALCASLWQRNAEKARRMQACHRQALRR